MTKTIIIQKKVKKPGWKLLVFLSAVLLLQNVNARNTLQDETKTVSGIVTDVINNSPLPGVSIVIKGTTTGTITDVDGVFSLDVAPSDILLFSSIGYLDEEIPVGDQTEINISLSQDIMDLDEVVVIGYGVQKKKLVTGATTQVKSEDFEKNHSMRLESSLQGMTPGMVIVKQSGQPGSDFNITIRGLSSPNDNKPLILIDGVPGDLKYLNPSDIESVDILKDAASAAIYGSRGGSGVILITTKKGKEGKAKLTYDFSYGISNVTKKVPMLNAKEYATIMNEASYNTYPNRSLPFSEEDIDGLGEGTDWQEEAYNKNAPVVNHYLGFSGGSDKSIFSLGFSYSNEEGIFDYEGKSNFERFGVRVNSEHKIGDRLTVGENIIYSHRNTRSLGTGNQYNNFIRSLLEASPLLDVYDPNMYDGFARSENNPNVPGAVVPSDEQGNPIASMHYKYNDKNKYDDIIGNVYGEVEIIKGLKFRSDIGAKLNVFIQSNATDSFTLTPYDYQVNPTYKQKMERYVGYNWDNVLSYTKTFGNHNVLAMIGTNVQDNWYFKLEGRKEGYLSNDAPVLTNVTDIVRDSVIGDFGKDDARLSFFGRLSYNYKEKYLATVSLRRDGSSRFGQNNRYGYFPAVSVGWVVSEESFLESSSWLNFFKLRASWGQNGKEPSDKYAFLATVGSTSRYYYYDKPYVGVSPDIFPNPDLKWEASEQINVGFDSKFIRDFSFSFDWYRKTAKDWILPVPVAGISGIAGINESRDPFVNGGNVINSGVEFDIGYNKLIGDLYLGVRAIFSYNKNKVTEVPGGIIHGAASRLYNGSAEFYRVEDGYPLGYFWGYNTDGLFQSQAEVDSYVNDEGDPIQPDASPGDVKRIDLNGDGQINDDDKTMIGDPNPDFIYGFTLDASYKGFDFSMNIEGQAGNQVVQAYRSLERAYPNYTTEILDRWQWEDNNNNGIVDEGEGTSTSVPRVTVYNENFREISDMRVQDAGYLRIKSVNIGYDFSSLIKNAPFEQLRIYFAATNLLTITKYTGLDPEVGYGAFYDSNGKLTDAYASGIDLGFYPVPRTFIVGLNITF